MIEAIYKLYPQVVRTVEDVAYDADGNEVKYDKAAVEAYAESQEYKSQRAAEYPSIADQLDTLYHGGYDAWKAQVKAVKDKYPKG
jgi:hypothetical protein